VTARMKCKIIIWIKLKEITKWVISGSYTGTKLKSRTEYAHTSWRN